MSTSKPLELIHMNLFGPTRVASLGRIHYALILVDDYSRFTRVCFLVDKNDDFKAFQNFTKRVQKAKGFYIFSIRSNHGTKFENKNFKNYCDEKEIFHNYSSPRNPQQNGVVERKNRTLMEMARTMLHEYSLPLYFWAKAVNTTC